MQSVGFRTIRTLPTLKKTNEDAPPSSSALILPSIPKRHLFNPFVFVAGHSTPVACLSEREFIIDSWHWVVALASSDHDT